MIIIDKAAESLDNVLADATLKLGRYISQLEYSLENERSNGRDMEYTEDRQNKEIESKDKQIRELQIQLYDKKLELQRSNEANKKLTTSIDRLKARKKTRK